jgi:3-oxoacyl-(acyl-carrier-protein) synthase
LVVPFAELTKALCDVQVRYIEAHGTGTKLGDSIEMTALGAVMTQNRGTTDADKCIIASGKANIGHLEAAAGACVAAGLVFLTCSRACKNIWRGLRRDGVRSGSTSPPQQRVRALVCPQASWA